MAPEIAGYDERLEGFRDYLALLARLEINPRLQGKIDLSGVVQQTLLEGHQSRKQLQEQGPEAIAAWLRKALTNNLKDEVDRLRAQKRDVLREQSLDAAAEDSSCRLLAWLAAEESSVCQQAIRHEEFLHLASALASLPEKQRQAVELHHLQGCSLAEVAAELNCSKPAVAGLLHRGLEKLRELLAEMQS